MIDYSSQIVFSVFSRIETFFLSESISALFSSIEKQAFALYNSRMILRLQLHSK